KVHGHWRVIKLIAGPEPDGTPCIECIPEMTIGRSWPEVFLILQAPLLIVIDWHGMQLLKHTDQLILCPRRRELLFKERKGDHTSSANQLHELGLNLVFVLLDGISPFIAPWPFRRVPEVVDKLLPVLVAAVAVPGHGRIILKAIEPAADQGIAALQLVIEEAEREARVHGFDPKREAAKFNGQRIHIDAIQAALHNMATEVGSQVVIKVRIAY